MPPRIISFPIVGKYTSFIKFVIEKITKCEVVISGTDKESAITLGILYSPKNVCLPFKYTLGEYLQSLRKGANVLIQFRSDCIYGYYAELQEQILNELGYDIRFVNLNDFNSSPIKIIYSLAKETNHKLNIIKYLYYLFNYSLCIIFMDKLFKYHRENYAKSSNKELFNQITNRIEKIYNENRLNPYKIAKIYLSMKKQYQEIPVSEDSNSLKILLIGDFYSLVEESINKEIENILLNKNITIYRDTNLTHYLFKNLYEYFNIPNVTPKYINYKIGGNSINNLSSLSKYLQKRIDGIIHLKSYGCIPELNYLPTLDIVAKEYNLPILYINVNNPNGLSNNDDKILKFCNNLLAKRDKKSNVNNG